MTSLFKSFVLGRGFLAISAMTWHQGTKFRCTKSAYLHASKGNKGGSPAFRGFSGLPQGSPPLRAAAGCTVTEHISPARSGQGTSGSGPPDLKRGGGAAWTGLDNRAAPARRLGRQVGPSHGPAGLQGRRPVARLEGHCCPVAAVEKKGTDRWGGRQRRRTEGPGTEWCRGGERSGEAFNAGRDRIRWRRLSARRGLTARWQLPQRSLIS